MVFDSDDDDADTDISPLLMYEPMVSTIRFVCNV